MYDGNDFVWFEQCVQVLEEFESKEGNGFSVIGEDVMDDVIEVLFFFVSCQMGGVSDCIFNDSGMVFGELEIFEGKFMYYRIDFDDSGVDVMCYKSSGGGVDVEIVDECQFFIVYGVIDSNIIYMMRVFVL